MRIQIGNSSTEEGNDVKKMIRTIIKAASSCVSGTVHVFTPLYILTNFLYIYV
jgi:hypothetical protein